ncbi:LysR family transcriptional regulator [Paraburkholderia sp. SIMBA_055]|uniref:Transcriptional regulator, LysR family n=1 Tax=Paraburkholderia graminis (strain ATCC 700544 / DSM 17151 / LMG 18924 / NCIMB 13744 / C4D1M) TaxID=396598 RepID=B1FUQ6_PARG4|nr:LysR family transcriptional regulator [Paraburkholderia graminis]EDT12211.1 transcriptional regulator, LysR family [Paraburkholderia graminis C4D1M]CAB3721312.1 Hca operon transcriptional activator HcaR [Paraburkholderia graminis C4D1M]
MIDIKPLRYFVTLAETRHFGRAAARLNLSQPPLSRQLAALEASLGVTLIERSPRSVTLTAAGERFYADAKAILASVEQAVSNAQAAASGEAGKLAIGFTMCAAYNVVPGYARAFGAAYPEVALSLREVVSNDLAAQVVAGHIDAAIMFPHAPGKGLATRTILREPLCVALSRGHPRARARRLRIAQLAGEPFVLASEEVAPTLRATILEHCRSGGFEPDIRFEVQLQQTVLSLVDEGVGVALVPASMRKAQLAGVVFKPLVDAPLVEQVLAWSPANRNPCLGRFLELA